MTAACPWTYATPGSNGAQDACQDGQDVRIASAASTYLIDTHPIQNHTIIVYCSSEQCNAADLLAEKFRRQGCQKVRVYPGGWEGGVGEWEKG
ncbi:MAG: hypothetical protein ALAOOOJD_00127 [bacterium]|nr:hypothetical protein [bacterium]